MAKILLCGHRAYAARELAEKLREKGHDIYGFSRGEKMRNGNIITGQVTEMDKNELLPKDIDCIINFILLDSQSKEINEAYIDALCRYSKAKHIKKLIQISSISVYPNNAEVIRESTPIDTDYEKKGYYGTIKCVVDMRLMSKIQGSNINLVFVRPGFITAADKKNSLAGIAINLPCHMAVLIGNKKSTLPIVQRDDFQKALINIVDDKNPLPIYLLVAKGNHTKLEYFKSLSNRYILALPTKLVMLIAGVLKALHLFDDRKYCIVKGIFKMNKFDATQTYEKIGIIL